MQLPAETWQDDILSYLNTDNRAQLRGTRQSVAKKVPQTPVCKPWECVWRPTLCSGRCDTFWSTTSELLENLLWFLHGMMADAYDNMIVQFEMGSRLLLWWTPNVDLFLRERDMYPFLNDPALVPEDYYKQVITDYFSKIHSKALKRTTNANTEDKEPFKLQLTIRLEPGGHRDISGLHEAVRAKFCRPQLMRNLYVYDVSTPVSVSILITDYPLKKAITTIPIYDIDGDVDMEHEPLWKSCT